MMPLYLPPSVSSHSSSLFSFRSLPSSLRLLLLLLALFLPLPPSLPSSSATPPHSFPSTLCLPPFMFSNSSSLFPFHSLPPSLHVFQLLLAFFLPLSPSIFPSPRLLFLSLNLALSSSSPLASSPSILSFELPYPFLESLSSHGSGRRHELRELSTLIPKR